MKLNDLLKGNETIVAGWLHEHDLIHECDCGYTVYDPDDVSFAVQDRWGDKRCDEIHDWACNLSNHFGWLFIESSKPEHGIFHCQHCATSEWSLLMDIMKTAEGSKKSKKKTVKSKLKRKARSRREKYLVYIDESYTNEFPRKPDGALTLAAFIVPEKEAKRLKPGVEEIIQKSYRGNAPKELKYSKISKSGGLLERTGIAVAELLKQIPSCAIIAVHVPSEGLMGEKLRSLHAIGHYEGSPPPKYKLDEAVSNEAVEAAVREAIGQIAQTISMCVASYIGDRNFRAKIIFDPRSKKLDELLAKNLEEILPKLPINIPLIPHGTAIVMPKPSPSMKRIGNTITIDISASSEETPGLQLADFIAGDIRTFFNEVAEPLEETLYQEPLVNQKSLFVEAFRQGELSEQTKKKIKTYKGKSSLPLYMRHFANGIISCYTRNGQMRNIHLQTGVVWDLMD